MNEKKILRIISIMNREGLDEIEVGSLFSRIRIVKSGKTSGTEGPQEGLFKRFSDKEIPAPVKEAERPAEPAGEAQGKKVEDLEEILSPMVGTFYRSPAPEKDPFVSVGNRVNKGDIICLIEAMKLMNEIESEVDGVIREILVDDAQPVEYGQPIFLVESS